MLRYALRRLILAVPTLIGITLASFLISHALPSDLVLVNLGDRATQNPELVQAFKRQWGLDRPLPVQYLIYLANLARGDLGISITTHRPVIQELALSLPATLELATAGMLLAVLPGIALGVLAATRRDSLWDFLARTVSSIGLATPTFWLAILMVFVFYFHLGWAPPPGRLDAGVAAPPTITGMYTVDALLTGRFAVFWNTLAHLVLPALVLAIITTAYLVRITRASMIEVLSQDYVRTAQAKGLRTWTVVARHALKNALIPIITIAGTLYAQLMAGTVLTETIFSWPGMGRYAFSSAASLDFPAIMGVALVVGVIYMAVNFVVDVLYAVVNPRVRLA